MPQLTTKPSIPLQDAIKLAHKLRAELLPYCHRVWIGGSTRRHKPFVGDIELVCIPKSGIAVPPIPDPDHVPDLIGTEPAMIEQPQPDDQLTEYLDAQCGDRRMPWSLREGQNGRTSFGKKNKLLTYNRSPVDVFSGTWANFGMLFFVRTGSTDWVKLVMAEFQNRVLSGHPYGGVEYFVNPSENDGHRVRAEHMCVDEERVFELLDWPFVNADDRTEERALELRGMKR